MKRNHVLDAYRGFTIISMVLFHLLYDINLYKTIEWYDQTYFSKIWQISIAGSFFIISGITSSFLKDEKNIKRGVKLSLLGILITIVTYIFARDIMIVFGVLNGLGLCMIFVGLIQKHIEKLNPIAMAIIMFLIFITTYSISSGTILFGNVKLPENLYELNLFPIGFPSKEFKSTDYFGFVPWIFLYLTGFFKGKYLITKNFYGIYGRKNILSKIGENSLIIYVLHQPILYLITLIIFS